MFLLNLATLRMEIAAEVGLGLGREPPNHAAAKGGGPSRLQLARLVAAVAELGSLGGT
jgi:hypothetical protein